MQLIEAGLPNITGEFQDEGTSGLNKGAFFELYRYTQFEVSNNNNHYWSAMGFDASRCSTIYGASTTVQPAAYTVYYIIRMK